MSNKSSDKRSNKVGVIFSSILAIVIIIILGLYFFTDSFGSKEDNDNSSNNSNVAENEVVQNSNKNNEESEEANNNEEKNDEALEENGNQVNNNETSENETIDESVAENNESTDEDNEQLEIEPLSDKIITALDEKDMETVARYVSPEKGLLLSPYVYVIEEAVVFDKSDVRSMLEVDEKYKWGNYDGKGTPIELTSSEYFDEFLDMTTFINEDEILIDDLQARGNTKNNIEETFPDPRVIEYYNEGTEEFTGIDWSSLLLVYDEDDSGELYLVAIVRDM